jgi:HEPN domain-containing protein
VTSRERADRLLAEASEILHELSGTLRRGSWNLAVRRSQEVVELALKGLLAELGVDYPKVHDVAPLFGRIVRGRGLPIDEGILVWLESASAWLAMSRGPAFYLETEFSEEQARKAVNEADRVLDFTVRLLDQIRSA